MDDLTVELGRFRTEPSAIFNTAGVAIYVAPSAQKVPILVGKWLQFVNRRNSNLCDIAITHFVFEKIHPFLDGNGRVGRILMNWQLQKLGYGFAGLISFEDYLEQNRNNYYSTLAIEKKDITEFVEFILETVAQSAQKVILQLQKQEEGKIEDILLPRRAEILAIIREHQVVTFDQIHRRFLSVNSRTLHYDLQDLVRKGLIRKRGATRGSVYAPK
ncbi:MAG: Filamentation induced by cAMP protein Fic [Microgenomates group bacterium GW2011_GWC1_39_7]|nr:MAG: Filamentation induced by cAMP protein Fic [Microgenomates group bacterium GW2011_GWC1_39_7]